MCAKREVVVYARILFEEGGELKVNIDASL